MTTEQSPIAQLDAEITDVTEAARAAKRERSADQGRLERRRDTLIEARRRYRSLYDQANYQLSQIDDQLVTAGRRLGQAQKALADAQSGYDSLIPRRDAARLALAAIVPIWPDEERYTPPDRQVRDPFTGQTAYFCGKAEVAQDGSPLTGR